MKLTGFACILAAAVTLAGEAFAQQPTANPLDAVPEAIPFDHPYGAPVTLERASSVVAAALAEAGRRGWKLNVAVVDGGGHLVAFSRMDGAQLGSIDTAQHKARAAAQFRRETKVFEAGVQAGMNHLLSLDGVIAMRGGVPLIEDGKIIGAVGVSGGTGSQDEVVAKAGLAAIAR